ncbi:MAG: hypothetical protein K9J37_23110 [Saprospiraceae bacterium]|nr:hypothetical protein [Saprospiraceae bacterium]MCF8252816.1 hypothetical protein [Saprospiraceae bacterium]MCF8283257.1 hypothetical protein [Bacteroidales bacterium]MCF8314368.1 hypothetical protein [Saprospiraceae bacterium]MCF8443243.1 hypothetical protein [Saprospiraceae bacterium]
MNKITPCIKWKIFVCTFIVCFLANFKGLSQTNFSSLQLADSLTFTSDFSGFVKPIKGLPTQFSDSDLRLIFFSNDVKPVRSVYLHYPSTGKNARLSTTMYFEMGNEIAFLNSSCTAINLFDDDTGLFRKTKTLKRKYKRKKYNVVNTGNGINPPFYSFYYARTKTFFLRIAPTFNPKQGFEKYSNTRYSINGLIGEFNEKGKLIKVHGIYDDVYKFNKYLSFRDGCLMDRYSDSIIIYSTQLSDQVHRKNILTGEEQSFGLKGNFINKNIEDVPLITSEADFLLKKYSTMIESPFYWSINVTDKYILRTYTIATKDTVSIDSEETKLRLKFLNGDIKGCLLPSKTEQKQRVNMLANKQFYIQVYDKNTFALLYDDKLNVSFPLLLSSKDDNFYFAKLDSKTNKQCYIYKFGRGGN